MSRLSQQQLAAMRPSRGVRITRLAEPGGYLALCGQADCEWLYRSAIRAVVEEQTRWHRQSHRSAS